MQLIILLAVLLSSCAVALGDKSTATVNTQPSREVNIEIDDVKKEQRDGRSSPGR